MLVVIYAWSPPTIGNIPDSGDFGVKTDDPVWSPKPLLEEKKDEIRRPIGWKFGSASSRSFRWTGSRPLSITEKSPRGPNSFGPTTVCRGSA